MKGILLILALVFMSSCDANSVLPDEKNVNPALVGSWKYEYTADGKVYLIIAQGLVEEGIQFSADNTLKTRKNAGWCGTPPITYGDFEGKWKVLSPNVYEITEDFWGGEMIFKLRVLAKEGNKLYIETFDHETVYKPSSK